MLPTYDLKYLEDPKETFGGIEKQLILMVRKDLEKDIARKAYQVLDHSIDNLKILKQSC